MRTTDAQCSEFFAGGRCTIICVNQDGKHTTTDLGYRADGLDWFFRWRERIEKYGDKVGHIVETSHEPWHNHCLAHIGKGPIIDTHIFIWTHGKQAPTNRWSVA